MVRVQDDVAKSRYVLEVDGERVGLIDYRLRGDRIALTHAEVDPRHERTGYGSQLAEFALQEARRRGLAVLPHCPFVRHYVQVHPEYLDLVPEDARRRFGL